MSLDTLLEAARYLELQEQKLRHHVLHKESKLEPLPSVVQQQPPPPHQHHNHHHQQQHHQHHQAPPLALHQNGVLVATSAAAASIAALPPPSPDIPPALVVDEDAALKRRHPTLVVAGPNNVATAAVANLAAATAVGAGGVVVTNSAAVVRDHGHHQHQQQQQHHVPCVMRSSGTREVHNKLEKHRRAHLKECFDILKKQLPAQPDEKKTSNLSILHSALRYIQQLKRKERELEHEMERLAREKIAAQQRLATLKKEFASQCDNIDFSALLPAGEEHQLQQGAAGAAVTATIVDSTTVAAAQQSQQQQHHHQPQPPQPVERVAAPSAVPTTATAVPQPPQGLQTVSVLPVSYNHQGLVLGLQKVALVTNKSLAPLVSSPVTHIITPSQLNGKVVPLMNAQYLVKPVVVVSTPSVASTISPRPS